MFGVIAAIWGFLGVCFFLLSAVVKLSFISSQLDLQALAIWQWIILIGWVFFMGYYEGYRGFQRGFSPRVAARVYYLLANANWLRLILAPLFCMGFFDAERKRIIVIVCLTVAIFGLINLVTHMPMPWRGIMDVGVIVGLSWGLTSMIILTIKAFYNKGLGFDAGVPSGEK